ncbi:MAG TPA: sigma-70 family RNA polymerase sigma factor [Bacteroidales bacterium]
MGIDAEKLVAQYGTMVSGISHRMILNHELAREAAQEVWYEVFKSLGSFHGDSELSTWIYTIAKRTILRYAKNEKTLSQIELEGIRALPPIEYDGLDGNKSDWVKEKCDWCLTALCHCLTNDARLIFIFRENIGLSYKQISKIMEMTEDNVRQISSRSLTKVRNFFKDTCPLYNPKGTCKCRITKHVLSLDLDKEYAKVRKIMRLVDVFQKFEKELPRKNYWEKFLN